MCFQVDGHPGGQIVMPRSWLGGIKRRASTLLPIFRSSLSLSLFLLSHSSLPPHDFYHSFTNFHSIHHQIHLLPSSSSYLNLVFLLDLSLSLSLSPILVRESEGGRRPTSSIKLLYSFATQGNSLSSNLLLFHGNRRIFLED